MSYMDSRLYFWLTESPRQAFASAYFMFPTTARTCRRRERIIANVECHLATRAQIMAFVTGECARSGLNELVTDVSCH